MRKQLTGLFVFFSVTALVLGITRPSAGAKGEMPKRGVVTYVSGAAQHREKAATAWDALELKDDVTSGETVQTKRQTRAEIELDAGKLIRLDENTIVDLVKLFEEENKKNTVTLDVAQGQVWSQIASLGGDEAFKINSPLAGASVRGTVFNFAVGSGNRTSVDVFRGAVEVYNPFPTKKLEPGKGYGERREVQGPQEVQGPKEVTLQEWYYIVRSMQRISIAPGQSTFEVEDIQMDEAGDEWRKWNEERDSAREKAQPDGGEESETVVPPVPE